MKLFIIIFIYFTFFASIKRDFLVFYADFSNPVFLEDKDTGDSLAIAVNSVSNVIGWTSVIIAILTLFVALAGFFGYRYLLSTIKSSTESSEKLINSHLEKLISKQKDFDNSVVLISSLADRLADYEKFMRNTNRYLYESLDKVANQIGDKDLGIKILEFMLHNYQITNLYSSDKNTIFASLAYLHENGTLDDIQHLEFLSVSNYVCVEYQLWAREIVGIIKHKNER